MKLRKLRVLQNAAKSWSKVTLKYVKKSGRFRGMTRHGEMRKAIAREDIEKWRQGQVQQDSPGCQPKKSVTCYQDACARDYMITRPIVASSQRPMPIAMTGLGDFEEMEAQLAE